MCPKKVSVSHAKNMMLDTALKAVQSGSLSAKQSATIYGVPITTIRSNLKKRGIVARKSRDPSNSALFDQQLIEWLQLMAEIECYSLKKHMGDIVNEIFQRHGYRERLKGVQGQLYWTDSFVKRHPELPKFSMEEESACIGISPDDIDQWFQKHRDHIFSTYNVQVDDFVKESNSAQIFCCFEVGSLFRSEKKISTRFIYRPSLGQVDGEFMLSLYCCMCADGSFLKPVAIVKDHNLVETTMESGVKDFHILSSTEGRMNCEAAMLWMQLIDVEIQPKKGTKPFLIYLDQIVRPLSLATLDFCRQRELMLFYLPGHYPRIKIPFGMEVFYNLNAEHDVLLSSDDVKYNEITSEVALNLLMESWKMMINSNSSITEFHDFGLLPLDMDAMKATVEALVPITTTPTEGVIIPYGSSPIPESPKHVTQPPVLDSATSFVPIGSLHSPTNAESPTTRIPSGTLLSPTQVVSPGAHLRSARRKPTNYKESSDTDESTDGIRKERRLVGNKNNSTRSDQHGENKPNIKIKIKRSEKASNNYSVEQDNSEINEPWLSNRTSLDDTCSRNESVSSCNQCDDAMKNGVRTGVVQGLVFALKRIESSLRADTLSLFKSRYLSPYLGDHRPTEPSFVMWCELMKCLEMGPDAVHQDFLLARSLQATHSVFQNRTNDCNNAADSSNNDNLQTLGEIELSTELSQNHVNNKKRSLSSGRLEVNDSSLHNRSVTSGYSGNYINDTVSIMASRNSDEPTNIIRNKNERCSNTNCDISSNENRLSAAANSRNLMHSNNYQVDPKANSEYQHRNFVLPNTISVHQSFTRQNLGMSVNEGMLNNGAQSGTNSQYQHLGLRQHIPGVGHHHYVHPNTNIANNLSGDLSTSQVFLDCKPTVPMIYKENPSHLQQIQDVNDRSQSMLDEQEKLRRVNLSINENRPTVASPSQFSHANKQMLSQPELQHQQVRNSVGSPYNKQQHLYDGSNERKQYCEQPYTKPTQHPLSQVLNFVPNNASGSRSDVNTRSHQAHQTVHHSAVNSYNHRDQTGSQINQFQNQCSSVDIKPNFTDDYAFRPLTQMKIHGSGYIPQSLTSTPKSVHGQLSKPHIQSIPHSQSHTPKASAQMHNDSSSENFTPETPNNERHCSKVSQSISYLRNQPLPSHQLPSSSQHSGSNSLPMYPHQQLLINNSATNLEDLPEGHVHSHMKGNDRIKIEDQSKYPNLPHFPSYVPGYQNSDVGDVKFTQISGANFAPATRSASSGVPRLSGRGQYLAHVESSAHGNVPNSGSSSMPVPPNFSSYYSSSANFNPSLAHQPCSSVPQGTKTDVSAESDAGEREFTK